MNTILQPILLVILHGWFLTTYWVKLFSQLSWFILKNYTCRDSLNYYTMGIKYEYDHTVLLAIHTICNGEIINNVIINGILFNGLIGIKI